MITIVDYGAGNLASVENAFRKVTGQKPIIATTPKEINDAQKIVFPGVGNFGTAMRLLSEKRFVKPLQQAIFDKKPFLGICLGMQLLFEKSEESPATKGLSVLGGSVVRFSDSVKVPQIGWNELAIIGDSSMFENIQNRSYGYFVHSFFVKPADQKVVSSESDYGSRYCASVVSDNVWACQFHPEKSGSVGLQLLKNFTEL